MMKLKSKINKFLNDKVLILLLLVNVVAYLLTNNNINSLLLCFLLVLIYALDKSLLVLLLVILFFINILSVLRNIFIKTENFGSLIEGLDDDADDTNDADDNDTNDADDADDEDDEDDEDEKKSDIKIRGDEIHSHKVKTTKSIGPRDNPHVHGKKISYSTIAHKHRGDGKMIGQPDSF